MFVWHKGESVAEWQGVAYTVAKWQGKECRIFEGLERGLCFDKLA